MKLLSHGLRFSLVALFFAVLLAAAPPARAGDFRTGERVVIEQGEVVDDDLFVSAETVIIDGTVTGDLLAAGTTVVINGVVEGSAMLGAQSLQINGDVAGSLYGAGYVMDLGEDAKVGRNLYGAAWGMSTAAGSDVTRSVYITGYQMIHDGRIGEDLAVALSALQLNGEVGGDVSGQIDQGGGAVPPTVIFPGASLPAVETLEPGLYVSPEAQIGGTVDVQDLSQAPQAEPPVKRGFLGLPNWVLDRVGEFIGLLIIGAALVYFVPRLFPKLDETLTRRPLPSVGWGALIALVAVPFALIAGTILIILLTVFFGVVTFGQLVGAVLSISAGLLAVMLLAFMFVSYVLAKLIVAYWAGHLILSRATKDATSKGAQLGYLALGLLLFEVLRAIPAVGWLLSLLVMFLGLGVLFVVWLDRRRGTPAADQKPVVAAAD